MLYRLLSFLSFLMGLLLLVAVPPSHAQRTPSTTRILDTHAFRVVTPRSATAETARPPLTTGRLASEALLGAVGGVALGAGGGLIGEAIGSAGCEEGDWFCGLGGAIIGVGVGYTLGISLGVYVAGTYGDQDGSYGATLLGSLLGGVAGIAIAAATDDADTPVISALAVSMPLWGAMIGFNRTRRYDASASTAALTLHGGSWRLGTPAVSRVPDPLTRGRTQAWRTTLVTARW